jgi:predicted DCC family thiol-disulfide oxidoreductase YuxK
VAYIPAHSHPWRPAVDWPDPPGEVERALAAERRLAAMLAQHGYILLYDGVCGLCNRVVQFVLKRDTIGTMRFATLQGELGKAALRQLPEIADVDSVILLHREGAWVRSTAALEVARYLGGRWSATLAAYAVPRILRDWVYDFIAKRRYRWFGKHADCPVPASEVRDRFLDP